MSYTSFLPLSGASTSFLIIVVTLSLCCPALSILIGSFDWIWCFGGHLCRLASKGCKLVGCGSSVPKLQISNDDLSKMVETSDEWISDRTGIRKRRILSGQFVSLYIKLLERLADLLFVFLSMIFWNIIRIFLSVVN